MKALPWLHARLRRGHRMLFIACAALGGVAIVASVSPEASSIFAVFTVAGCVCALNTGVSYEEGRQADAGRDADDRLIHSQKMAVLGELSSGIAHEINTPLGIIGQETELLSMLADRCAEKGFPEIEELRERLGQIALQVERCGEITHQLLAFARKNRPLLQETDVSQVAEDMIRLVEREARHQQVLIRRDYDVHGAVAMTDPALLRQLVLNLLQNAVQAIGQEGVVMVSTHTDHDIVELRIADTGCGIAPENLQRVFDPFFTTKPPGKGTGLGLSICMKIAHRLGGDIQVHSQLEVGTEFTVRLPLLGGVASA